MTIDRSFAIWSILTNIHLFSHATSLLRLVACWYKSIHSVGVTECSTINPVSNEAGNGPICKLNYCIRNCLDGYKPMHPKKVRLSLVAHIISFISYHKDQTVWKIPCYKLSSI